MSMPHLSNVLVNAMPGPLHHRTRAGLLRDVDALAAAQRKQAADGGHATRVGRLIQLALAAIRSTDN
jgi:hypothetical protein